MGSNPIPLFTKRYARVIVKAAEVGSLRTLSQRMNQVQRRTFVNLYGKILDLALIEVPREAIIAIVQYYDQPLRCFTFRDFQLMPTLEEFEKILGCPIGGRKPYLFSGHYPTMARLATIMKIQEQELTKKQINRNDVKGLPRDYLEKKARSLADLGDWKTFMDVLALLIYGVVLFPRVGGLIDSAAVDAFLAFHHRKESPVVAILANTYYTLNLSYEKKGSRILCCLPALYVWLVSHVFNHDNETTCPIEDFHMCLSRDKIDWKVHLAGMNRLTIRWYPKWKEVQGMLCQCGDFPNVPLMGTRGCINYNPILAIRQLGYPICGPPSELAITPFIVHDLDKDNSEMLKRIRKAWGKVIKRDKEFRTSSSDVVESYNQWLENRVQEIKLPVQRTNPGVGEVNVEPPLDKDETRELKTTLERTEVEKENLKGKVTRVCKECAKLQKQNASKPISTTGTNSVGFEQLLAGYLAHEFLTKGTLLGQSWAQFQGKLSTDEDEELTETILCRKRRRNE